MSLYAYNENGYLGDFATNRGAQEFSQWVEDSLDAAEYPELNHLAIHGWTDEVKALVKECTAVRASKSAPTNKNVMKTLVHLATLAKKPCETFIISDGVGHEDDQGAKTWRSPRKGR